MTRLPPRAIWGGEFGRTPHGQNADGHDHNSKGFTFWLAGDVKRGLSYSATGELGYEAVDNPMHIHVLHVTIVHILGLDHERLTYRYAGRDMRFTESKAPFTKPSSPDTAQANDCYRKPML